MISPKLDPQVMYLTPLWEKGKWSINVGGNKTFGTITGAVELKPIALHAGVSQKWDLIFKETPSGFVGFEIKF